MGSWIAQAFVQAVLVATAAGLTVFAPWRPLQFGAAVFLVAFLVIAARNPALAYRRAFRFLVLAVAGSFAFGTSGRVAGKTQIPDRMGDFGFLVEWGTEPLWWVALILAAMCLIGDISLSVLAARRSESAVSRAQLDAVLGVDGGGNTVIGCTATLVGRKAGSIITGAKFGVAGWRQKLDGMIFKVKETIKKPVQQPVEIAEGVAQTLHVSAKVEGGFAKWLRLRARWSFLGILPLQGELTFATAVGQEPIAAAVRFKPAIR